MRFVIRPLAIVFIALASVAALTVFWTLPGAVLLSANTTALIMGGTFHSLLGPKDKPDFVADYLDSAQGNLDAAFAAGFGPVDNAVAVFTPEDFFPIGKLTLDKSIAAGKLNLDRCLAGGSDCVYNADPAVRADTAAPQAGDAFSVFGYSQSAVIASLTKRELIEQYQPGDPTVPFMLVANPMRPNGGVLMRLQGFPTIPILGISFPGASPTDSAVLEDGTYAYPTVDIVRQYDGFGGDFPVRPLNLIATLNALVGYALLHGTAVEVPLSEATFQGREGDTSYYLVETDIVPLLQTLAFIVPKPILRALDAPLRVIIEDAYNRDVGPGVPTRASLFPINDLIGLAVKLLASIPVAVDNFVEGLGLPRLLGTTKPGAYGVGGLDVTASPEIEPSTATVEETQLQPVSQPLARQGEEADGAVAVDDEAEDSAGEDVALDGDADDDLGDPTPAEPSTEPEAPADIDIDTDAPPAEEAPVVDAPAVDDTPAADPPADGDAAAAA